MTRLYKKKLIEVALPLPEINDASAYDKMPGIGPHPKGIHQWWARLPLPTARAVLFASVVDDPSEHPEKWPTEDAQNEERERLFGIVRTLLAKKLHEQPQVYETAREEIARHCDGRIPSVLDPFAGGGSIPLEAQRLGFDTHGSDLNPIAVLINKVLLEIVPKWGDAPPVHPFLRKNRLLDGDWRGSRGLAADLRQYADDILRKARTQLSSLYPHGPGGRHAIAWLWCRTVASPDPSCRGAPLVDRHANAWAFKLSDAKPTLSGTIGRRGGTCILTGSPIPLDYIRVEGKAGRLGLRQIAVVGDGREYFAANEWPEATVPATPLDVVSETMPTNPFAVRPPLYGCTRFCDLFTPRQLRSLGAFSDLISEARSQIAKDACSVHVSMQAEHYADSLTTLLAFALDRCVDFNNSLCRWSSSNQKVMNTFGRQAMPMIWDFAEANLLADSVGSWSACSAYIADCIEVSLVGHTNVGTIEHLDAVERVGKSTGLLVSTDPPYYNNVDYSDLSDFFYVWLRRTLAPVYPALFRTVLTPKTKELVASPYRFDGDKEAARDHFEKGFRAVFGGLSKRLDPRFPMTVYYAFKQSDEEGDDDDDDNSVNTTTGWETLLEALVGSGFQITGTWPVRASQRWRQMSMGMNALASYIVLTCRPRPTDDDRTDRRSFVAELKKELPPALKHLQQGNIAPVDFAQAALGPGMAVFSRYSEIVESDGRPMSVRNALGLINQTLSEVLSALEDDFDADTRWAIAWFEQQGFSLGSFGDAEVLSKAKVTSVSGLQNAGVVVSRAGEVRLVKPEELPETWDPQTDKRLTVWETVHHLIRALSKGETVAASLVAKLGSKADVARELAYRLFDICEKRKRAQEAQSYNGLVMSWPEITRLARTADVPERQAELF